MISYLYANVRTAEDTAVRIRHSDHVAPLPANVGTNFADKLRSVSIVHSWTQTTEFSFTQMQDNSNSYRGGFLETSTVIQLIRNSSAFKNREGPEHRGHKTLSFGYTVEINKK
jgi:hypothetical protein